MRARLGGFVAVLAAVLGALGCGSTSRDVRDATTQKDLVDYSECAIIDALPEDLAACGVPTSDECCGRRACPFPYQEACAGSYPYGCCSCFHADPQGPRWRRVEIDCWPLDAGTDADADGSPDAAGDDGPDGQADAAGD